MPGTDHLPLHRLSVARLFSRHRPRRLRGTSLVTLLLIALAGLGIAAGPASASTCAVTWGSLAKSAGSHGLAPLTGVRSGRHACYDRLVVDLAGHGGGYRVQYVSNVYMDASGALVPLRGGAKLQVVVLEPAYDINSGALTYNPANRNELTGVGGYSTFRQVAWAGTFEGQTTIGLGVRARLPFRVFTLAGPGAGSRLVIDVAHHW